jgi:hypothetical protein
VVAIGVSIYMLYSPTRNHKKGMHLFSPRRTASAVLPAATSTISATASAAVSKLGMGVDDAQNAEDPESPKRGSETSEHDETMEHLVESPQYSTKSTDTDEITREEDTTPSNEQHETIADGEVSDQGTEILRTDNRNGQDYMTREKEEDEHGEWAPNLFYAYARRV